MMPQSHESRTEFLIVTCGCTESYSCNVTDTQEIHFISPNIVPTFLGLCY